MLLFNPIELASVCGCPTARLCEVKRRDCRRPFDSVVQRVIQQDIHTHTDIHTLSARMTKKLKGGRNSFFYFFHELLL
jgi:hypothetical protein